jgi:hypothetical protein
MLKMHIKIVFGILLACFPVPCFAQSDNNSLQRGQRVMEALAAAYPDRIEKAEFKDGDWTVLMRGNRYYFCGGRLLPEELRDKEADYSPQPFYHYAAELPPWKAPSAEDAERFKNMATNRSRNPVKRSPHFFDALWQAGTREESQKRLRDISFLGFKVAVHEGIREPLARVEARILAEAQNDSQLRAWINSINTTACWNWRTIADTQTRSYHAYGVAIDILPKQLGGKETYWLWAARNKPEWWNIPYSERLHPPAFVIRAFESQGFIWGGKWLFFDTMHFEYRPEIFILSGMN